ncbi:unnamed protein product [Leptidea sinapis]|uniref:Uncharacterized protein n=1 Tax=Leptidea sinapis TaxID=189913 RepID=A0A5E4QRH5_9NEOP|nr:unnamed protein product [Leptidea sinapis]
MKRTSTQRVVTHAMISMIENHLSWVIFWWRAKYPDSVIKGYQVNLQNALNTRLPNAILNFCYKVTSGRKGMKKAKAHGIGVHSQEEIIDFGKNDLRVLSDLLADKPWTSWPLQIWLSCISSTRKFPTRSAMR